MCVSELVCVNMCVYACICVRACMYQYIYMSVCSRALVAVGIGPGDRKEVFGLIP